MEIFSDGLPSLVAPVLDHLWQSTAFAGLMALAAFALRKNRAVVRFWLWLAASMKFLVPCSLLMEVGEVVRRQPALATAAPTLQRWPAIQDAGQALFTPGSAMRFATTAPAYSHAAGLWRGFAVAIWACGFLFVAIRWVRQWRAIRSVVRNAKPIDLGLPIPTVSAVARLEPGVFGIFRPVLFLPEGITERLAPPQMQALFAHEMCHVRRRDNLWAAVHVLVEAIFWFHPLVWWLGARMIAEREAACDEAVLRSGAEAETYATSVLEVCRIYAASPMPAIAGITGADLKQRVLAIASQSFGRSLSPGKKLALALVALAAMATPIVFGLVSLPSVRAQVTKSNVPLPAFDAVTIKPPDPNARTPMGFYGEPGGRIFFGGNIKMLVDVAFNLQDYQIDGIPDAIASQWFAINAVPPDTSPSRKIQVRNAEPTPEQRLMLQSLLADRFGFKFHLETKEGEVYILTRGAKPLQLKPPKDPALDPRAVVMMKAEDGHPGEMFYDGEAGGTNTSTDYLATRLSRYLQLPVLNQTGINGLYDYYLPPDDPENTDLVAAVLRVADRLGLKLTRGRGPVETLVIDHVEQPSPN